MSIKVVLGDYLREHGLTPYRLVQETEGRLAKNTVYAMARGEAKRVDLRTLDTLMNALRRITGEAPSLEDVLVYTPTPEGVSASGLPYTGDAETDEVLDDPEMTERLLTHKREFEGLSPEETKAKLEAMLERGELVPLERLLAELA